MICLAMHGCHHEAKYGISLLQMNVAEVRSLEIYYIVTIHQVHIHICTHMHVCKCMNKNRKMDGWMGGWTDG